MKNAKGQSATEFVLVLPFLCAALLIVIMFIIYCVRAEQAMYAGYMASRVYGVWPETVPGANSKRDDFVAGELSGLLGTDASFIVNEDGKLQVESVVTTPLGLGILDFWKFTTQTPIVTEPMSACEGEDNPLPTSEVKQCLQ